MSTRGCGLGRFGQIYLHYVPHNDWYVKRGFVFDRPPSRAKTEITIWCAPLPFILQVLLPI